MKVFLYITVLIAAVLQISAAEAVTCATPPSCADLGYNLSAPTGDLGYACAACPFDATKWACSVTSCPSGYQTGLKGTEFVTYSINIPTNGSTYYVITYKYRCHWGHSGGRTCRMSSYGTYKFILSEEEFKNIGLDSEEMQNLVYVRMCGAN